MDTNVAELDVIPGLPPGTKYSDLPEDMQTVMYEQSFMTAILMDIFKLLGLSDKTILIIEQEFRNKLLAEQIEEKRDAHDKKRKALESNKKKSQQKIEPVAKEIN